MGLSSQSPAFTDDTAGQERRTASVPCQCLLLQTRNQTPEPWHVKVQHSTRATALVLGLQKPIKDGEEGARKSIPYLEFPNWWRP